MTAAPGRKRVIVVNGNQEEKDLGSSYWHLDKRVPISIILALLAQLVGFAVLAAKLDSRVGVVESSLTAVGERFKLSDERYEKGLLDRDRLARVEEQLKGATDTLHRIEMKLDSNLGK